MRRPDRSNLRPTSGRRGNIHDPGSRECEFIGQAIEDVAGDILTVGCVDDPSPVVHGGGEGEEALGQAVRQTELLHLKLTPLPAVLVEHLGPRLGEDVDRLLGLLADLLDLRPDLTRALDLDAPVGLRGLDLGLEVVVLDQRLNEAIEDPSLALLSSSRASGFTIAKGLKGAEVVRTRHAILALFVVLGGAHTVAGGGVALAVPHPEDGAEEEERRHHQAAVLEAEDDVLVVEAADHRHAAADRLAEGVDGVGGLALGGGELGAVFGLELRLLGVERVALLLVGLLLELRLLGLEGLLELRSELALELLALGPERQLPPGRLQRELRFEERDLGLGGLGSFDEGGFRLQPVPHRIGAASLLTLQLLLGRIELLLEELLSLPAGVEVVLEGLDPILVAQERGDRHGLIGPDGVGGNEAKHNGQHEAGDGDDLLHESLLGPPGRKALFRFFRYKKWLF